MSSNKAPLNFAHKNTGKNAPAKATAANAQKNRMKRQGISLAKLSFQIDKDED